MTAKSSWIAADWGTTNLRIWGLDANGDILAHRSSDQGMGKLGPDGFEPALLALVCDLLPEGAVTPVIICGMAGSRQGWAEAPYKPVPCPPPGLNDATAVASQDPRLDVRILPGIKQSDPNDVMRGEETQIAGFLAGRREFTGLICLPGTHTKWVLVEGGQIVRFRTCMSGETFALLGKKSVLRHSLPPDDLDNDFDKAAFRKAVEEIMARPQRLAGELFGVRANSLLDGQSPAAASGRLSGLLIGGELAAMASQFDLSQTVLLGSNRIANLYAQALETQGHKSELVDADAITLNGLRIAYQCYGKGLS